MKEYPDLFGELRESLLDHATALTRKWCVPPEAFVDGKKRSDQYWIKTLAVEQGSSLDSAIAHLFLVGFQLTNRVAWDKEKVAEAMRGASADADDAVSAVSSVASKLREANHRGTQQTSAASKIAFFARPSLEVYIWDRLATKAARFREWDAGGRNQKLNLNVYVDAEKRHAYGDYWRSCKAASRQERECADFTEAAKQLVLGFRAMSGPMSDAALIPDEFIERRLLDKLMFCEGLVLEGKDFRRFG